MMDNDELLIEMKDMFEKNMDKMDRKFDERVEEMKRYTGVLVEDLRKDVKAIAEGHSVLDRKIDTLHEELTETKQELKTEIKGLTGKIDGLEKNMTVVKDYVIGVDAKLNEHEVLLKRVK